MMPIRLSTVGAVRAPSSSIFSLLRPFSSTAAAQDSPATPRPPRTSTPSSTSRLQSINTDRSPRSNANARSGNIAAFQKMGQNYQQRAARSLREKQEHVDYLKNRKLSAEYLRQMPRRWNAGDVYSPHDLSPREMDKWRKRKSPEVDVVDVLGIRPVDMYKVGSRFTTHGYQLRTWAAQTDLSSPIELLSYSGVHKQLGPDQAQF